MKKNVRKQGILLPISSIPSAYGIGTFGKESYRFVDFLEKSGNHLWQILPLGPTGYGDSPYQSFSTFAGNPYYIDLELLIEDGYLTNGNALCQRTLNNYTLPSFCLSSIPAASVSILFCNLSCRYRFSNVAYDLFIDPYEEIGT